MKIIRYSTFETNSSSAHSLVICKEPIESDLDKFDYKNRIFGNTYDDIISWHGGNIFWDEEDKKCSLVDAYEFNYSRGNPRVYDDFIHKIVFVLCYYKWRLNENKEEIDNFLDKVTEKAILYSNSCDLSRDDSINILINIYLKSGLLKSPQILLMITNSEFSNSCWLVGNILEKEDIMDDFIFNDKSYIVLSGDEYQGAYLKLVGTEYEYTDYYGSQKGEDLFEERVNNVYPDSKYMVDYNI